MSILHDRLAERTSRPGALSAASSHGAEHPLLADPPPARHAGRERHQALLAVFLVACMIALSFVFMPPGSGPDHRRADDAGTSVPVLRLSIPGAYLHYEGAYLMVDLPGTGDATALNATQVEQLTMLGRQLRAHRGQIALAVTAHQERLREGLQRAGLAADRLQRLSGIDTSRIMVRVVPPVPGQVHDLSVQVLPTAEDLRPPT